MNWLNALGGIQLPEIRTDVGQDVDAALRKNATGIAIMVFIAVMLAMIASHYVIKRLS